MARIKQGIAILFLTENASIKRQHLNMIDRQLADFDFTNVMEFPDSLK